MLEEGDFDREQSTESSLLASVKEQEAQFKRLTMELEEEQRHVASYTTTNDSDLASYHSGQAPHFSANGTALRSGGRPFLHEDAAIIAGGGGGGGGGGADLYYVGAGSNGNGSAHLAAVGSRTVDPRRGGGGGGGGGGDGDRAYYSLSRGAQRDPRFLPAAPHMDDYSDYGRGGVDVYVRAAPPGGAGFGPPGYATLDERRLGEHQRRYAAAGGAGGGGGGGGDMAGPAMRRSCDELNSLADQGRPFYPPPGRSEHGSLASLDRLGYASGGGYAQPQPGAGEVVALLRGDVASAVRANAAAYLQHACYENERAKAAVREARGVRALVALLDDVDEEVQRSACGALRNISYGRDVQNKLAVKDSDGITALIGLLQRTHNPAIVDVVTGTLWNLSSHEPLKKALVERGLGVLVERVVGPESGWHASPGASQPSPTSPSNAFRNTTGCLRNVSSAGADVRLRMRQCEGLVDSLLHFVCSALEDHNTDTKAVENSVCILRNLSCDIFRDVPAGAAVAQGASSSSPRRRGAETRCFAKRDKGNKGGTDGDEVDIPPRKEPVRGWELLYQPEALRPYVSLLKQSRNPITLEAATSAIYTLASGDGQWAEVARAVVRKEEGLPRLVEQLRSERERVVCASAHALRGLARDPKNKALIGTHGTRNLVQRLPEVSPEAGVGGAPPPASSASVPLGPVGEDGVAALLGALAELATGSVDNARHLQSAGGIERAVSISASRTSTSRELRAASALLTALWSHREMHSRYKKDGWTKMHFQGNAGSSVGTVGRGKAGNHDDTTLPLMGTAKKSDGQPRGSREQLEEIPLEDLAPGRKY